MQLHRQKIAVLGSGNFGTCLAQHLAKKNQNVTLWGRKIEDVAHINQFHQNPRYLAKYNLSTNLVASADLQSKAIVLADVIVFAIPTQSIRSALSPLFGKISPSTLLICAAKGIESDTLLLPREVIAETLGLPHDHARLVVLSGPSFADEIIRDLPTCVSIASCDQEAVLEAQTLFHAPRFRCYTSNDPRGLEIAGALKNVIAIAAGACEGLGFENNARAALITRGLAEISRFGVALGAVPLTFKGLGGVGDLFLTCTSLKSRNFKVGFQLGQGNTIHQITSTIDSVAEGIATSKAAHNLAKKLGVDAPITDEVYDVLYEAKPVLQAVSNLLNRDAKPEFDSIQ